MNRRAFAALTGLGLSLPLLARSSRADELERNAVTAGKSPSATPSSVLGAEEIVARMEAFYGKVSTFKASFEQRYFDLARKLSGSVSFERPSKMSWRYDSGARVVCDGTRIRVYEPDSRQLFDEELFQSLYPAALSFLTAQGKLTQNFGFTNRNAARVQGRPMHVLVGKPLQPSPACQLLAFYIDARSFEARRVQIRDAAGNRHRFEFAAGTMNARVPVGEFVFRPPLGTRVIQS